MRYSVDLSKILIVVSAISFLSGCAVIPENLVKPYNDFSYVRQPEQKPRIFLDYKRFGGMPGEAARKNKILISHVELEQVSGTFESSNLFSEVIFDDFLKEEADYTIEAYLYIDIRNRGLTLIGALLSGFSFGLIPSAFTNDYVLEARVIDRTGNVEDVYQNHDAITGWFGILVIPFGSKYFNETPMITNMLNDSMRHMVEGDNSVYSRMAARSGGKI